MSGWDQVQTEFAGDETTNFGPRKETGTALYQVDTLATISTQNQVASEVKSLVSAALGELVCVGVEQHLSIFKDSQHEVTIAFENVVEDCAWSPDGSLLLVVDAGGKLFMFSADTLQSIFSYNLLPGGTTGGEAFRRIVFRSDEEACDLILLSATGLLFAVKGFNPAAFTQGSENLASVVQEQLQFRTVQTSEAHTDTTWDALPLGNGSVITVGSGDSVIAVWAWQDNGIFLEDSVTDIMEAGCGFICAKLASNNTVLCALDEKNRISIWLVPELVMLSCTTMLDAVFQTHVTDFLLLETQGTQANSLEGTRLVVQEQDETSSTIHIIDVESAEDIYALQLGAPTSLARCPPTQESLYVAEGTPVIGAAGKVSSVRLRCLMETNPETRLQRILHKKRFEEALQFAQLFQLDAELVYKAQMNQLLDQLSPWSIVCYEENKVAAMLTQLWTSVDRIKDSQLIAENCMRAALPTFSDTWKLLQLCHTKLSSATTDEKQQALQTKVLALQNRLMTYKLAFGVEEFSASGWIIFQQANLVHMVCRKMTEHQPHIAILLWRRHSKEWREKVTLEVTQQILQAVPQRLIGANIMGWLQDDLLPYIARFLPQAMGDVVQWAIQRAGNMELVEKDGWPQSAITFLEGITSCISDITEVNFTTTNDTAVETATKTQIDVFSLLEPLCSTLSMLHQLQDLLKYNLRLSAKQFQQETKETLAFRMLDQVVMVEMIKPTLEKYITPYMRAHGLDQDNILATYIKDLLERLGHMRSYTGQSAWEDKVLAIVTFIYNPKEKCCAVLNVIKHAPLPWSAEISKLVEEGLTIQHPLVGELQEQKKIAGVRQLMQDYGLKSNTVPSQSQAEKLSIFMVEQVKPKSLEDALRVLKEYNITTPSTVSEVYFRYANVLIRGDRVLDYLRVLRSMDPMPARRLGERVVSLAEICLEGHSPQAAVREVMDEHKQRLTLAAVLTLQYLIPKTTTDPLEQEELKLQLLMFSKLAALQREYKMIMSVSEYSNETNRGVVFAKFTQNFLKEKTPFQGAGHCTALYRLAELLQLQREVVQEELAVIEGRAGNLEAVLFLCRELLQAEPSKEVGRVLRRVVSALLQQQGQGQNEDDDDDNPDMSTNHEQRRCLSLILQKLADRAVVMCDPEILVSCIELSKATRLWQQVSSQCEATETTSLQMDASEPGPKCREPLQIYTLDTVYTDEALVMSSSIALPLAASSLAATTAVVEVITGDEDIEEDEENSVSAQNTVSLLQPVIAHLRENSHLQLALRYLIFTTTALQQALLQHDMGFPESTEMQTWLNVQRSVMQAAEKAAVQLFRNLMSAQLLKVLSAHRVDHKMALACLLSLPRKVSMDCLKKSITTCNFNFRKLGAIASVGVALGNLLRESKLISYCQDLETGAAWGVRLAKLKISFKEAFQGGVSSKQEVIAAMAHCKEADVKMVADFAVDFRMEADDGLMVFMEELLKTCQGATQLSRAKAAVAAVEARDRAACLDKLKSIYKQTSPYNYEVIEFLLGEINRLDTSPVYEKGLKLVSYLKVYTRRNPPSEYELTSVSVAPESTEECGDIGDMLPHGSKQRVPLHLLLTGEPWKIITAELDAETVPKWLKIAELLELSTDEVYMMAGQNIVRRHVANTTSAPSIPTIKGGGAGRDKSKPTTVRSWKVSEASLQMLEQVQHLLSCVRSCEMALACANWVVRELPMGGDKVLGLQGCVAFAQRWYTACEDNSAKKEKAHAASNKFQKVLRKVLTEQALYINHLAEPQLLQLVAMPTDLISRLTEHAAVLAQTWEAGPVPDIYSTIQQVCKVNDLDIGEVLVTAVHKWLLSPDSAEDNETTMNLSFSNLKMTEEAIQGDGNDNIKRVLYFLNRGPRQEMLKLLISTVQSGEGESTSHLGRMHCLYCLLQIADDADLQPLGHSCHSIREMLRVSCYLTQLEELHIQHSVQTLTDCNKTGLVKSIWRNHKHQKSAVRLSAALCLDYKLHDRQQWAAILQQMITLHMLCELEHVLQRLTSVPTLWSLPILPSSWQAVLTAPLNKATLPLTEEQTKSCLHCFNLLQSCPVLGQLNLSAMTQHFERLQLDVCAAACMMMDPTVSHSHVQELLSQDSAQLIDKSYSLIHLGLNLPAATQVREAIFHSILQQGDYHMVGPQALQDFIHFIILQDNIDGCLVFAVSNDMLAQAESLIELYLQHHPERHDEVKAWCENNGYEMDSSLHAYLHMKELV
ncbi:kinetochore-associated protein 1-like [Littorina saxatilis]|uniref:Kinetochore-associated protein 1 n=1 Tax=Littorina saxatilis TaxID=31220 RepID=A0AAN9GQ74_9CAEN